MDSSNAEKAAALEWLGEYHGSIDSTALMLAHQAGQRIGRASRDAEVAELTAIEQRLTDHIVQLAAERDAAVEALAESRARFGDSEARRAELEAVIEKVRDVETEWRHTPRTLNYGLEHDWPKADIHFRTRVLAILREAESPSVVLEDRDREVAARTLEEASHIIQRGGPYFAEQVIALTERAAAIRKGDTNA